MKALTLGILIFALSPGLFSLPWIGGWKVNEADYHSIRSQAVAERNLDIQIEINGEQEIHLSWSPVANATSYLIYHAVIPLPVNSDQWSLLAEVAGLSYVCNPTLSKDFFYVKAVVDDFALVEGGTFFNGTSDVTISTFYIDRYEITQSKFQAVMSSNPSYFTVVVHGPVENVSWFDAIKYCNLRSINEGLTPCYSFGSEGTDPSQWSLNWNSNQTHVLYTCNFTVNGYRLPTEMEWMFAARGGNQTHGYDYSGSNVADSVAWYNLNSGNISHPVGTKIANELGIYDMSGNVMEWVWDIWGGYPSETQTDPTGPTEGNKRVRRGGSWYYDVSVCAVSYRYMGYPITFRADLGFRVCRSSL